MRRTFGTPAARAVFLCTFLASFAAIAWAALQPYPFRYSAVMQACAFACASCVHLLLKRLLFARRAAQEGAGPEEAARAREAMACFENVVIYSLGLVMLALTLHASAGMEERVAQNPVYCVRVDAGNLRMAFAGCLAAYFFARPIAGLAGRLGGEARAVARILVAMGAAAGMIGGILANVRFVGAGGEILKEVLNIISLSVK